MDICVEKLNPQEAIAFAENRDINRAAFLKSNLWDQNDTIRIFIHSPQGKVRRKPLQQLGDDPLDKEIRDYSPKDAIQTVVKQRIQPLVNLKLKFVDKKENSDVRIGFIPGGGSFSLVGNLHRASNDEVTMNFGRLSVGVIEHEFGHLLGMIHEHQNPRGEKIQWNAEAVYEWAAGPPNFWDREKTKINILDRYDVTSLNGSEYDPESVMLYFYPAKLTVDGRGTKPNPHFSDMDKKWISTIYPPPNRSHVVLYIIIIIAAALLLFLVL